MIVLFTDFGVEDPYVGQMHGVLAHEAPGVPVIDLFHAVPNFDIQAAAYLLPAYVSEFPAGSVFLCVVDPGVGSARRPMMLEADGRWFVGPDNGIFHILVRRARSCQCYAISWRPLRLSISFHGRDLFAPVAAMLARGEQPAGERTEPTVPSDDWPDDLPRVLYVDHYGNAVTGVRAAEVPRDSIIEIGGQRIGFTRVFAEAPAGRPFWHENANGLVEIAVNQGRADRSLGRCIGAPLKIVRARGQQE